MLTRTLTSATIFFAIIGSAQADDTFTAKNDLNRRPVRQIAAELGVAPQQFADCFEQVEPARDFKPSKARERANKAKLLPCLQAANAEITNDHLDSVMDKYRGKHIN